MLNKIPLSFFRTNNVQDIAKNLLGNTIYTNINGKITSAIITETEAYQGPEDQASHAYNNKRTARTEVMYETGGCCYIYLCYGIHYLFNIVTNVNNVPHAILVRSGKIHSGFKYIQKRRGVHIPTPKLLKGPGNFAKGLGITMNLNGIKLNSKKIWIENNQIKKKIIKSTKRVGIDYAGKDALLPWRYILKDFR